MRFTEAVKKRLEQTGIECDCPKGNREIETELAGPFHCGGVKILCVEADLL